MVPALTLFDCVFLPSLYTCTLCTKLITRSICVWTRKSLHLLEEGQNLKKSLPDHVLQICMSHDRRSVYLSSLVVHFLFIMVFESGVEVAFYNAFAVAHNKVVGGCPQSADAHNKVVAVVHNPRWPTTKLISSNTHVGVAALSALMMLLRCLFAPASFTSRNSSSLSVGRLDSKIHTILRASLIATLSGRLPWNLNLFIDKDIGVRS